MSEFAYTQNSGLNYESVQINTEDRQSKKLVYSPTTAAKPNDVFALAKAFLAIEPMTNKKLQKLCYYAKAWYLAIYDQNIIPDPFEAWIHGAVQPRLYQKYKEYGFSDIPQNTDLSNVPEEYISFAKEVFASYGHLTGDELERLNHTEYPWIKARKDCKPWETCRNQISEQDMKNYYRKMLK